MLLENKQVILIRYSEVHLKKRNRSYFLNILKNNIKKALSSYSCTLEYKDTRFVVKNFEEKYCNKIIEKLQNVFGISSISKCIVCNNNIENFKNICLSLVQNYETFKIETNRANKKFETNSVELNKLLGEYILSKTSGKKVMLFEPQVVVNIDIRDVAYIYVDKIKAISGMPLFSSGLGLVLLSGGIDSPVAAYMMMSRGMNVKLLHFHSYPYTSINAQKKTEELKTALMKFDSEISLSMCNIAKIQEAINNYCNIQYNIILLRRAMFCLAEKIAKKNGCQAIITGESLAQVASQTIESINCVNSVVDMPVLRPLIGLDKEFIIQNAKKIGTYNISIKPFEDCCTAFLPENPIIKPKLEQVQKEEKKIPNYDEILMQCLQKM